MRVIHSVNSESIVKNTTKECSIMLTNKIGGYLLLSDFPKSRYEGFFINMGNKMYKIIENIRISEPSELKSLKNNFYYFERKRQGINETFFMPYNFNSLVYELNKSSMIDVIFDGSENLHVTVFQFLTESIVVKTPYFVPTYK